MERVEGEEGEGKEGEGEVAVFHLSQASWCLRFTTPKCVPWLPPLFQIEFLLRIIKLNFLYGNRSVRPAEFLPCISVLSPLCTCVLHVRACVYVRTRTRVWCRPKFDKHPSFYLLRKVSHCTQRSCSRDSHLCLQAAAALSWLLRGSWKSKLPSSRMCSKRFTH